MMQRIKNWIEHIKTIGALSPVGPKSTKRVAELAESLSIGNNIIVEYGPGSGNITEYLCNQERKERFAFEVMPDIVEELKEVFDPNVIAIIESSASTILDTVKEGSVDVIVSTAPFSLMSEQEREKILRATQKALKSGGIFISGQYRATQNKRFEEFIGRQQGSERVREGSWKSLLENPKDLLHIPLLITWYKKEVS